MKIEEYKLLINWKSLRSLRKIVGDYKDIVTLNEAYDEIYLKTLKGLTKEIYETIHLFLHDMSISNLVDPEIKKLSIKNAEYLLNNVDKYDLIKKTRGKSYSLNKIAIKRLTTIHEEHLKDKDYMEEVVLYITIACLEHLNQAYFKKRLCIKGTHLSNSPIFEYMNQLKFAAQGNIPFAT